MKSKTVYICEKCRKESEFVNEILSCEAAHLGLTVNEYKEYLQLRAKEDSINTSNGVSETDIKASRVSESDINNPFIINPFAIEGKISDEEIVERMKILTLFNRKSITDEELENLLQMVLLVNNLEKTAEDKEKIIQQVRGINNLEEFKSEGR